MLTAHMVPDGPTPWRRVLVLFTFATFIEAMFWGQVAAFTPLHLPRLGVAAADLARWTGWSAAIASAVGLPLLPFWGALADRYARRPIILRSFAAHLLAAIVMLGSGNLGLFVAGRALMGLSLGNSGLMMATLSETTPPGRVGLAFSFMNSAAPLGVFLGPLIGGPVVDAWGFRTLLGIDAGLMAAVIVGLAFGYRETFRAPAGGPLLSMAADSIRVILRSARLRTIFPALFILFTGWMMAFTYIPLAVAALYRGPDPGSAVGVVLAAGGLATLVMSPAIGAAADRFGHWRVLFGAALIEVMLWPMPALAGTLSGFGLTWGVLNGLASAVFAISFTVLSGSADVSVRGRVMSFAYLPVNVGSLLGPAIGAYAGRENVFYLFPLAAGITALGISALFLARRQPA